MSRLLAHLLHTPLATHRAFPEALQVAIGQAVAAGERTHRGEIRVVVEGSWPLLAVLAGKTVRERAIEVFGMSRVWDTAENTGLLIYVLLCEQKIEILADRGLHGAAGQDAWDGICARLSAAYREGHYREGTLQALERVHELLSRHFPAGVDNPNELPDAPVVLR
ncbi:MAG TPA: TPM domain-containing protein [Moraxellaceae bacterium]|nr:TPM domain-containing protein [Moraxellaceae bacterium]